jgi:hypothetical protein
MQGTEQHSPERVRVLSTRILDVQIFNPGSVSRVIRVAGLRLPASPCLLALDALRFVIHTFSVAIPIPEPWPRLCVHNCSKEIL